MSIRSLFAMASVMMFFGVGVLCVAAPTVQP